MTPDQIQKAILDYLRNVRADGPVGEQLGDDALNWVHTLILRCV